MNRKGERIILLPYGNAFIEIDARFPVPPTTISYQDTGGGDPSAMIKQALEHPTGGKRLSEIARGKKKAVILISDMSRLCPSYLFLPDLLRELNAGGVADDQVRIVIALGMHRKQTDAEMIQLVGESVFTRVTVVNHSPLSEDCVYAGKSSLGTPFEINRIVAEADLLIATGNIEPHRLVGVSGGVKALIPGTASHRCIEAHHALSQRFRAKLGEADNPLHRDLEEVLEHVPIHFLFNVIVNHRRELLAAFAGELQAAHRSGMDAAKSLFFVPSVKKYDVVIASTGGYPKDIQLYQAVKTLQNAAGFTKKGGTILLIARCQELFGNGLFQYWVETIRDRPTIVRMLQEQFVLGPHKIAHIDQIAADHTIYLHSDIPDALAELAGFIPVANLNETIDKVIAGGGDCETAFMPYGALTFPAPS